VDHLAFKASGDIKNSLAKLDSRGIEYSMRKLQRTGVVQVFFRDPDGVGVELNFQPDVSY
jgi:catechol 2,3-dioxygenase-like lactoylglutathione lyase family enzyme